MKIVISTNSSGAWPEGVDQTYPHIFLTRDNWNDYGFETKFFASLELSADASITLGAVKVGAINYSSDQRMRDILPAEFFALDENYFSLGQSINFYYELLNLEPNIRAAYATAMRDIPLLNLPVEQLRAEDVFETSLLRTSGAREALDKAPALFNTQVDDRKVGVFEFETKFENAGAPHRIRFDFAEDNGLPHRINVLVGVNGVGKTQLMARLAMVLSQFERAEDRETRTAERRSMKDVGQLTPMPTFYSVIAISFSAFDDFQLPDAVETDDYRYAYCGLRNSDNTITNVANLATRIATLIQRMSDERRQLAVSSLSKALGKTLTLEELGSANFYRTLSAGQRIVANIIADLAQNLRSRSLILLDEPETHLHPQLVSRLLSVLNDLIVGFDSAAVIATHTPIVVQQVIARRVHIIRRVDDIPVIAQPLIETFGENLTEIVRTVFDAVESDRGYQEVLDQLLLANNGSVAEVEHLFNGRIGFNAHSYLRSRGGDS